MNRTATKRSKGRLRILVLALALLGLPTLAGGPALGALPETIVDDFESGLPDGTDGNGIPIGFFTFSDGSPVSIAATDAPPLPVPGSATDNMVLALTGDVTAFAGFVHAFENAAVDTWVPQDWSSYEGLQFWLYGQNTGTTVFVDVIDNRNPGSTTDDGERFTVSLIDDFSGWQLFEFPFAAFVRKGINNGAPNDGFTLTQVHGWALGTLNTPGEVTYYIDGAALYGVAVIPELAVTFASANTDIGEGLSGNISVKLNRPMNSEDPAQVSIDYDTEPGLATPGRDYAPTSGTLTFVNGGPSELSFPIETFDDTKWEGDERVILRLSNPVDVATGFATQAAATIKDDEVYDPELLDDFEQGAFLWDGDGLVDFESQGVEIGSPNERPGQDVVESVLAVSTPTAGAGYDSIKQQVIADLEALLPASPKNNTKRIEKAIDRIEDSLDPNYWINGFILDPKDGKKVFDLERQAVKELGKVKGAEKSAAGAAIDALVDADAGLAALAIEIAQLNGGDPKDIAKAWEDMDKAVAYQLQGKPDKAVEHYRKAWQDAAKAIKDLESLGLGSVIRDFPIGQDWTGTESLDFWFSGTGSGEMITVNLKDNRAPDPGPAGWSLVWGEEYNEPAGTPPNPAYWSYEIGDGTVNGIPGWGNDEFQYYTDDPANAATDGRGNMVLTVQEADGSLQCYYGPCDYTSARLVSSRKAEFAYGRLESRILVPDGGAGLWPAFWSLGTDIDVVGWPQTGEIDFMEYVSRLPNEIFGTIHGPGYSGGQSFGNVYDFGQPVYNYYHTFAIEWEPDLIKWYVDDILYHTAVPDDVSPNEWVFNDPVFLIFNVAIGGNFGGDIDPNLQLPQSMAIDYVRVYQGPDTAERFEATFTDDDAGWQEVSIPMTDFVRSVDQPAGAPDDGLGLDEVWGYGFDLPYPAAGTYLFDQVRRVPFPPPTEITVTNLNNSGDGSLRQALEDIAVGGTITFDPALAGGTIALTSGQLAIDRDVIVNGVGAAGLNVSGSNASRVFEIGNGASASITNLAIVDGAIATTGAGIQVKSGGSLTLTDSSITGNVAIGDGGGVFADLDTNLHIERSTLSGNSGNVGGALRTLGDATVVNSTLSGNAALGWWGGAIFHTDGVMDVVNSTISGNVGPEWAPSAIFVGSWGPDQNSTLNLVNSIVADSHWIGCYALAEGGGSPTLTADHNNVFTDDTCFPGDSDEIVTDAGLDALADNGGPTLTHALLAGSPAIDVASNAACPAVDQRGVARDAACDVGSFELIP